MSFEPSQNYIGLQKAFSAQAQSANENRDQLRRFVENFAKRLTNTLGLQDAPGLGFQGRLGYVQFLFVDSSTGKLGTPVGLDEIEVIGDDEPSAHFAIGLAVGPESEPPKSYFWAHYFARLVEGKATLREQWFEGKVHTPPNTHLAVDRFIAAAAVAVKAGETAYSANREAKGTGFAKIEF